MRLIHIVLLCGLLVSTVTGDWIGDPTSYFEVEISDEVKEISHKDMEWTIEIHENVGTGKVVGNLLYQGSPTDFDLYGEYFTINNDMQLVTRMNIDYETVKTIDITIVKDAAVLSLNFVVLNLNDNPIILTKLTNDACTHPENKVGVTTCVYVVYDKDGISEDIQFIYESNRATIPIKMSNPEFNKLSSEVTLEFVEEVDFEKENSIVVDWIAKDEMGDELAGNLKVIINIVDEPDEPPIWKKILGSKSIQEEQEQIDFEVKAQDGDVEINSDIIYSLTSIIPELVKDNITIHPDTGILSIYKIDRDLHDINSIDITIVAKEAEDPHLEISQAATILVKDINDNSPEITLTESSREIDENFNEILTTVEIDDSDIDDNGRYEATVDVSVPDLNGVFKIIPSRGYQKTSFSLSVIDGSKLDYDANEELRKPFQITIKAADKDHKAKEIFTITLRNINDEKPTFVETEYSVQVPETFGRKGSEFLPTEANFYAIDKDFGDYVTYKLIGKATQLIMELENEEPGDKKPIRIRTKPPQHDAVQIFDYELQEEVVVTIEAQDNFPDSVDTFKVITQLTIKLTDVNDEAPSIRTQNGSTKYLIMENTEDISAENIIIIADDPDSGRKLEITIDWGKSYAMKNKEVIENDDFNEFLGCFYLKPLISFGAEEDKVQLMIDSNKKLIDFEVFDTLYLEVVVEDKNTDIDYKGKKDKAQVTIVIDVQNDNDCPPVFVDSTFDGVKIKEHADANDIISYISATDEDHDKLTYELYKVDGETTTLVQIDENDGKLSVLADKKIDAEYETSCENLYFQVIVYDKDRKHKDTKELKIYIIDINDNAPEIGTQPTMEVMENRKTSEIWKIPVTDKDRDAVHREVTCNIIGKETRIFTAEANEDNKEECVVYLKLEEGNEIDREDVEIYTVKLNVWDNPSAPSNAERKSDTKELTIVILDENDNEPVINYDQTHMSAVTEDTSIDEVIGTIVGTDPDKGENGRISYFLTGVQVIEETENQDNLKKLSVNYFDLDESSGKLKVQQSLRGFYGDYNLIITTKDNGEPQLKTTDQEVKLHIDKYNYSPVKFGAYEDKLLLKKDQELNQNLILRGDQVLKPIKASDGQDDKYNIAFEITEQSTNGVEVDYFKLAEASAQSTNLQLKSLPSDMDTMYKLKVSANSINANPPSAPAYLELTIQFFDDDTDPVFVDETMKISFDEEFIGDLSKLPEASYSVPGMDLESFYKIHEASPSVSTFTIKDKTKTIVSVKEKLDLVALNGKLVYLVLRASQSSIFPGTPNKHNLLRVDIKLNDINNHPPKFRTNILKAAIIVDQVDNKIKEVPADDPDADTKLSYFIDWETYKPNGEGLPTAKDNYFEISDTGVLAKKFKVTDGMSGNIQFNAKVSDGKHTDTLSVTLYVISNQHLVSLQFENTKKEIEDKQQDIIDVLKDNFDVDEVGIQNFEIVQNTEDTANTRSDDTNQITDVTVFFIKNNTGVDKEEILKRLNDLLFHQKLSKAMIAKALNYRDIITDATVESMEEVFKIALIAVSVVAGAIIIGLIAFFTWKIRSQSNRLDRLEHAEARRPTAMLANIPGANRRATEFINPNFKNQQNDDIISNNLSFASSARSSINKKHNDDDDDEDFIGVENSDIFKTNANNKDMQF